MDELNIISRLLDIFNVKSDKLRHEYQTYENSQTTLTDLEKEYSEHVLMADIQEKIKKNIVDVVNNTVDISDVNDNERSIDIENLYDIKNFIHDMKRLGKMYKFRRLEIERNITVVHLANTTYKRINVLVLYMKEQLLSNGVTAVVLDEIETKIDTCSLDMLVFKDAEVVKNQTKYTVIDYTSAYTNRKLAIDWIRKLIEEQRRILIEVCRYTKLEYILNNMQQSNQDNNDKQNFTISVVLAILFFSSSQNDRILNVYAFLEAIDFEELV